MDRLRKQFWLIAIVGILFFSGVYGCFPFLRKPLVRENNILEMLQVFLYLGVIWQSTRILYAFPKIWIRKIYLLIPLLGVFAVLEEISYGDTIFPLYQMLFSGAPRINNVKFDAFHDIFEVAYVSWGPAVVWGLAIFFGCSLLILVGLVLLKQKERPVETIRKVLKRFPPLEFLVLCAMGLVMATFIDLNGNEFIFLSFIEESLEAIAALALLYATLAIPFSPLKFP